MGSPPHCQIGQARPCLPGCSDFVEGRQQPVARMLDMDAHCLRSRAGVARLEGIKQRLMLAECLLGDAAMKHQTEDMEMRVLECQHLADQLVASKFHDAVMENSVLAG